MIPRSAGVVASRSSCTQRLNPSLRLSAGSWLPLRGPATTHSALLKPASSSSSARMPLLESAARCPHNGMGARTIWSSSSTQPPAPRPSSWDRRWWQRPAPQWTPSGLASTWPSHFSLKPTRCEVGLLASCGSTAPTPGWPCWPWQRRGVGGTWQAPTLLLASGMGAVNRTMDLSSKWTFPLRGWTGGV